MASKDSPDDFRSVSGQAETAEPASAGGASSRAAGTQRKGSSAHTKTASQGSTTGGSIPILRKSSSSNLTPTVASPLPGQSPRTSRTASPIRPDKPAAASSSLSTQPSAAAIQRALSASSVPQLQQKGLAVSEAISKLPGRQVTKSATASGESTPQWPISPRLKSPPPSGPSSRRASTAAAKKPDTPSIQVLSATPQSNTPPQSSQLATETRRSDVQLQAPPPPKTSSRGPSGKSTLETVQENAADSQEPSRAAVQAAADLKPLSKISDDEAKSPKKVEASPEPEKHTQPGESGSESAGKESDYTKRGRRQSTGGTTSNQLQKPKSSAPSKGSYSIGSAKARQQEAGKQNMTVETETVASIPQSGLAPARDTSSMRSDNAGTVKLKPSNETIRPKKERKKVERKTRSVNQGTATSKADLFEARVANAVDEASTSDSDETFVYESNPPEPQRRPRHHSRTPSVASSHSIADQQRGPFRGYGDPFDERRIGVKRSMKFSSNTYNQDPDTPESNNGTVRSAHTPRHFGKFGRGGHHSITYGQDSPFTQASKLRNSHVQHGRSRPNSPKSPQSMQFRQGGLPLGARKQEQAYDFDAELNADDERTPLMGTVRNNRRYHGHRFAPSVSQSIHSYEDDQSRKCCGSRLGACLLTTLLAIMVVASATFFVFASNRALYDVKIHKIQNVLASEQELMFDLLVGAVNPNTVTIPVNDVDVNIFAKSKHVGSGQNKTETALTSSRSRRRGASARGGQGGSDPNNPSQDPDGHWNPPGGDKKPESDEESESQTMLLGRIFHFDQALSFEASPIKQQEHVSSGQLRLAKPGNKTESGGTARWEEVIQYPFELIVRGVLRYQLPISSRMLSAAVSATVKVHPEEGIDHNGNMRVEPIDHSDHWEWIDWPDVVDPEEDERTDKTNKVAVLE